MMLNLVYNNNTHYTFKFKNNSTHFFYYSLPSWPSDRNIRFGTQGHGFIPRIDNEIFYMDSIKSLM